MKSYLLHVLLSCCLIVTSQLQGQVQSSPGITVTGTAEMTKQPEIIRVQFKQYGKGNDQEAAKTALVAAEKKLMTKLSEAGAEVIVSNAGMSLPSQNLLNQYRNVSNIMMQRQMQLGGGAINQQNDKSNAITYLERYLTIDLKPKSKTKEPLILLADLQERLRKDYQELSGMTDALPKDDNNNVINNNVYNYRNDSSMFANDVRFQIAAKITREDRIKLYGEAIKRAKTLAGDLAEAAEMKVGPIQTISSNFSIINNVYSNGSQRVMNATGELTKFPFTLKEDGSESVAVRELNTNFQSAHQEPLTFGVSLTASFKLEPGK